MTDAYENKNNLTPTSRYMCYSSVIPVSAKRMNSAQQTFVWGGVFVVCRQCPRSDPSSGCSPRSPPEKIGGTGGWEIGSRAAAHLHWLTWLVAMHCSAVMGQRGEEQWDERAALRDTSPLLGGLLETLWTDCDWILWRCTVCSGEC